MLYFTLHALRALTVLQMLTFANVIVVVNLHNCPSIFRCLLIIINLWRSVICSLSASLLTAADGATHV